MLGVRTCATLLALALGGCESSSLSWHPQDDDGTTGADGGSSGSVVDSDTKTAADRYAHARCTAMFACPCTPHHYDDIDQCELAITQLVHNATTELFADPRCLDRVIEELETQSCETLAQLSATVSPCRLYAGSAAVGEPCASIAIGGPFARSDGCAIGLTCSFGTCIDEDDPPQLPPELAEDAPCGPEIEGVCADGLHCDDTVGR